MKHHAILLLSLVITACLGCQAKNPTDTSVSEPSIFQDHSISSLVPEEPADNYDLGDPSFNLGPLKDFNFAKAENFRRLSLDDCIQSAMENSEAIRDLGGTILRTPDLIGTQQDPALVYTDPNFGEEAALSAFDANLNSQFLYQKTDRPFNSTFIGNLGLFDQDLLTHDVALTKRSATGATYRLNSQLVYDRNNTLSNRFDNDTAYDTFLQAEIRQPLLQGAGTTFNRIAGPNNLPGVNNGVLVARANTDISLADFEIGIRDLVSDVENAYWDLYFSYRDLEAKIEARNGAYQIWQRLDNNNRDAAEVAQAKEQYYRFAADVQDAIHGRLNDGTRTNNGSASGTFRPNGGVRVAERRLRLIAGFPLNDSQLIVPSEMPVDAKVVFDWMQSKDDALIHRTELRRQRWVIKRESLELVANRNHLMPRFDLVSRYRVRGFGNDLYGSDGFDGTLGVASQNGSDALATMLNNDFQEWELGFDVNVPIGFRRQNAAVRNSILQLQRERAILREQQRQIVYGLSNAIGELERASGLLEVNQKRLEASREQYKAIQIDRENDKTTIDLVLESQRRVIEAKRQFYQTQVEFMLAVKSVHFEKGTLLDYHSVNLTESGWTNDEYAQAQRRESLKTAPLNYSIPGIHVGNALDQDVVFAESIAKGPSGDFSVADQTTEEGQAKLADATQFLATVDVQSTDAGALRSMALEIEKDEKAEAMAKSPFKAIMERVKISPFNPTGEKELERPLDEDPIFDVRKSAPKSKPNSNAVGSSVKSSKEKTPSSAVALQSTPLAKSSAMQKLLEATDPAKFVLKPHTGPIVTVGTNLSDEQSGKQGPAKPNSAMSFSDTKKIQTPVVVPQQTLSPLAEESQEVADSKKEMVPPALPKPAKNPVVATKPGTGRQDESQILLQPISIPAKVAQGKDSSESRQGSSRRRPQSQVSKASNWRPVTSPVPQPQQAIEWSDRSLTPQPEFQPPQRGVKPLTPISQSPRQVESKLEPGTVILKSSLPAKTQAGGSPVENRPQPTTFVSPKKPVDPPVSKSETVKSKPVDGNPSHSDSSPATTSLNDSSPKLPSSPKTGPTSRRKR